MKSGENPQRNGVVNIQLSDRDQKILRHVGKFGLSLFEVIHFQFFKGMQRDAVKSTLRRLCGRGPTYRYLRPVPLFGSKVAYQLTLRGANVVGVSPSRSRRLGIQSRVERLAILRFIHDLSDESKRSIITNAKLREFFPLDRHRLPRQRFYIEERSSGTHLGFIVVDHGGHERRIVRKAVDFLTRFLRHAWFDDYVRAGQFVLTVLTFTDFKARVVGYGLKKLLKQILGKPLSALRPPSQSGWPLPVDVVVIPGLINVIPGKTATSKKGKP